MTKILIAILCLVSGLCLAQTKTTSNLQTRFPTSFDLYFYKNTLRMLNQQENKEFDALIKNIQKIKFLMIDKAKQNFDGAEYSKLKLGYQAEKYEEIMTMRYDNKNFDIYMREKDGETLGSVILVNDSTNLYVLDILGSVDVGKASKLFSTINESSDFGKQLNDFMNDGSSRRNERGKRAAHVD